MLIPEGFHEIVIPDHPADLGCWLQTNGIQEDIIGTSFGANSLLCIIVVITLQNPISIITDSRRQIPFSYSA